MHAPPPPSPPPLKHLFYMLLKVSWANPCKLIMWYDLMMMYSRTSLERPPHGPQNVVCQNRWCLVTGSVILKCRSFCQKCVVFQDRWPFMAVVSQDRFHCRYRHRWCQDQCSENCHQWYIIAFYFYLPSLQLFTLVVFICHLAWVTCNDIPVYTVHLPVFTCPCNIIHTCQQRNFGSRRSYSTCSSSMLTWHITGQPQIFQMVRLLLATCTWASN